MRQVILLAAFLYLLSVPAFAETWTGYLVDAKCYASEERNVNPFDSNFNTNHDRGYEIRVCQPSAKTRSFTVVDSDGVSFELDPSGNGKAADVVRQAGKTSMLSVTITGQKHKDTVSVTSISPVR
jgi:hypothetical protein